jgi:hypothetical protein
MPSLFLTFSPRMDLLWANRHIQPGATRLGVQGMVSHVLHRLHPRRANWHSVLLILEIAAALLSVWPEVLLETLSPP